MAWLLTSVIGGYDQFLVEGISTPAGHSGPTLVGSSDGVVRPVSGLAISDADLRCLAEEVATVISRTQAGTLGPGTFGSGKIGIYKWSGSCHACTVGLLGPPSTAQAPVQGPATGPICFYKAA